MLVLFGQTSGHTFDVLLWTFIVFSDGNGVSCVESPILQDFRLYAAELTARHDRHERIVRLSRDVTTESKRVIFFLHSLKY